MPQICKNQIIELEKLKKAKLAHSIKRRREILIVKKNFGVRTQQKFFTVYFSN